MEVNLESLTPDMIQAIWILAAARVLIWILFANAIRKLLLNIAEENRFMKPNQVWWLAIPFINVYWTFEVVRNVSNSLNNEFFDRKIAEEENPGRNRGMLYAWMFLLSHIPFPGFLILTFFTLSVVYFIQYWVKIANFKNLLVEHNKIYKQVKDETAGDN
jgi:hypothetical protein